VVAVASIAHNIRAKIDFDDLQWESRRYDRVAAYGQSKLANLMFTYDLQRRLAAAAETKGAKTIAVAAHPGGIVCIVSHKATIRLMLGAILGFDPRRYRDHLDLNPASLTILDFRDSLDARLTVFNDVAHYSTDGLALPPMPGGRLSKAWSDRKS
jgi:hypothetical protein